MRPGTPIVSARRLLVAALLPAALACNAESRRADDSIGVRQTSVVPAYLEPIFRALDTLLTHSQRDTLRKLPVDSAFLYRTHRLAPVIEPMAAAWSRTPVGDTLVAHGERVPGVMVSILLDLYQQHLRGERVDLAAALRRMSPEYVSALGTRSVTADSVLVERDVDGGGTPDRLVREVRRSSLAADDDPVADRRLALYLDAATSTSRAPAWSTEWDDMSDGTLQRIVPVAGGGSLLLVSVRHADADEQIVLDVRGGEVRTVLRQQTDYGEGSFSMREENGRTLVTATGDVQVGERRISPRVQCPPRELPGSVLAFDASARRFVAEGSICVPRSASPAPPR